MEPITREEYYLAKIAGTYEGKTPKPVTNDEYYLATMAGDYSGNTPQPVTRLQYYMAKVAGVWDGSIPAPVTRLEYYWAAIANGEGTVFPPVTREEHFLVLVADAYSVVLTVVTGNPALLENSKGNRGLESLTLYGKSTQGSTPSPSYPQEIENAGQSGEIGVQVYGGNLFDIRKASPWEDAYGLQMSLDGEYITVKGVTTTTRYGNVSFRILGYPVNLYGNRFSMDIVKNVGTSKEYVYTSATENVLALSVVVDAKAAVELKFRLMVNAGSTALPYEPYKPAQKLIIPTPGGLPGIPVSSGGNYTDEKGQQWVADEIDLAKGERVQWTGEYRFTGAEAWNSWGVNKYTEGITGFYWYFKNTLSIAQKRILNTHAVFSENAWGGRKEDTVAIVDSGDDAYLVWSVRNEYLEDISDKNVAIKSFKKMLGEINAKMLYCLAEPIRTPLQPETIAAYKALKTYSPTTTVINDASAGMSVGYAKMK